MFLWTFKCYKDLSFFKLFDFANIFRNIPDFDGVTFLKETVYANFLNNNNYFSEAISYKFFFNLKKLLFV